MKKKILSLIFFLCSMQIFAQSISIIGSGTHKSYNKTSYPEYNAIRNYGTNDYLFVFYGIDTGSLLEVKGISNDNTVNWYKFSAPTVSIGNQPQNFNIEDMTGYTVKIDEGTEKEQSLSVWVIDYKQYEPKLQALVPENNPSEQCSELKLFLQYDIERLYFQTKERGEQTIYRNFKGKYNTVEYSDKTWNDKEMTFEADFPTNLDYILITAAPLCDTKFTIEGDNFAEDLGLQPFSVTSEMYRAVAVETHIVTTTSPREEQHEDSRPQDVNAIEGSSPLDITFNAYANAAALYHNWTFYKDNSLLFTRSDRDQQYTFAETGVYRIVLTSSNQYCTTNDSVIIKVSDSDLQVPFAFTPNGDGKNDEFRIAYRSLATFKCWIFNRWGRQIYFWTDPQKGWDGTIHSKPASTGGYIYIVEATGSDGKKFKKKGIVNLLRGKE